MPPAVDLSAPPRELYEQLAALDDDQFDDVMADAASREKVIDALVGHFAGAYRPQPGREVDVVIHLKLWDRPGGGYDHREVVIDAIECRVSEQPAADPDLTLKVRPSDLRKMITGQANPMRMAFRGKLRVIGDLGLARRLDGLFEL
jgi:putative sterol carrier protein